MSFDINTGRASPFGPTQMPGGMPPVESEKDNVKTNNKGLVISAAPAGLDGVAGITNDVPPRNDALGALFNRAFDFPAPPVPRFV